MDKTTIQVGIPTLNRLKILKEYSRQSYEELLNKIIDEYEEDEVLSDEEIKEIEIALKNVKEGKVKPIEQVAKELGVTLR